MDFDNAYEPFYFVYMAEDGTEFELDKGGKDIKVTNLNKKTYVRKLARHYLLKECKEEIKAFVRGFYQVIPFTTISVFDFEELDFLMNGAPEISVEDWRTNTEYRGEFSSSHRVIKWFWQILSSLSQE